MKTVSFLLLLCPVLLHAQNTREWGSVMTYVKVNDYAGKKFKLEAAIKVQPIDPTAGAAIIAWINKADRTTGSQYNLNDKEVQNNNWAVYTINGKIDKDAAWLSFGGSYSRSGIFYFDHFRLWIETSKNKYEEIPVANNDFEADTLQNWFYDRNQKNFSVALTTDTAYNGKKCIKVDGSGFKKEGYGNNDSTGRYATVNGIKIYYETYGSGEPLLLLHGNSSSIISFKSQLSALSKKYRVIAVDTRGQGNSGDDGRLYTYDLFAEDMNALLDHLHIDSANIVGWSDGGNTGLIMAMKYPAKVKKLITMGANVFIDNTVVESWVFKELSKQLKELESDTSAWGKNRARLINMLLTEPRHSFNELKAIQCPVLVMAGEKDVIRPEHTRQIAAHITKSTLLIVPKETHYYPAENAASFNKTVLEYFSKP
jgi:pimeloyl-ACP methyl ester carboxylesterase